jgi:hypothetical protein
VPLYGDIGGNSPKSQLQGIANRRNRINELCWDRCPSPKISFTSKMARLSTSRAWLNVGLTTESARRPRILVAAALQMAASARNAYQQPSVFQFMQRDCSDDAWCSFCFFFCSSIFVLSPCRQHRTGKQYPQDVPRLPTILLRLMLLAFAC